MGTVPEVLGSHLDAGWVSKRRKVSVSWCLPVGVASVLLYLVQQLRVYPDPSLAVEALLWQALTRKRA